MVAGIANVHLIEKHASLPLRCRCLFSLSLADTRWLLLLLRATAKKVEHNVLLGTR